MNGGRKRTGRILTDVLEKKQPKEDVVLLPSQTDHAERMLSILSNYDYASDFSCLGAGKTYVNTHIVRTLNVQHCVCVCPVSVKTKWAHMRDHHGLPLDNLLGFCELRSVKCKQPKHGLLVRRDYSVPMTVGYRTIQVDKVDFTCTNRWKRMAEEGVVLLIDEAHNLKNVTSQFAAAQAMVRGIIETEDARELRGEHRRSKVILLTGSPFDKMEQVTTMCRLLGIMKREELGAYNLRTRSIDWLGMQDIYDFCGRIDVRARARVDASGITRTDMREYAYRLYQDVIKLHTSSSMPAPECGGARIDKRNGFYEIELPEDRRLMIEGVGDLANACHFDAQNNTVNFAHTNANGNNGAIQAVTRAMMRIETAKIRTIIRVCRRHLHHNPQSKVVLCMNYTASIIDLRNGLAEFSPLVLTGSTSSDARCRVLANFQRPTLEHRLLIGNIAVCCTGIDLDDKQGGFPRFALVSPNYSTIQLYQLVQRFLRADTKSDSEVHFVFGKHAHEVNVLSALARKSTVMKETTSGSYRSTPSSSIMVVQPSYGTNRALYPGEYERWDEPVLDHSHDGASTSSASTSGTCFTA